jgi:hypothetical protein
MLITLLQFIAFNKEFVKARPRLLPLWSLVEGIGCYLNTYIAKDFVREYSQIFHFNHIFKLDW